MHSVLRKLATILGLGCLTVSAGMPAPEFDVIAGSESAGTGIYAENAPKHEIGTKLKAQAYAGADFHFDTNIMLRNKDEEDSFVSTGVLGARLLYEAERLNASLLAQINGRAFSGFGNLAGVTGHADARGEYSVSDSTAVLVTDLFEYSQDPIDVIQDVRAERWSNTLMGKFSTKGASWDMNAGVVNTVLDYNEDRFKTADYIMLKGFLEGAFDAPFNQEAMGISETRMFVRVVATNYTHQSQGLEDPFFIEGLLGIRGKWQTKFVWDMAFGAGSISVDEQVDDPADEDQDVIFVYDAQIKYMATERTIVTLASSRHGEVSQFCNYSVVTRASLDVYHQLSEKFDADVLLGYQYAKFSIQDADLVRTNARVRLGYIVRQGVGSPDIRVYADYTFTHRDGDQITSEYDVHQVGGGVAAVF